jgi:hypothetical protein
MTSIENSLDNVARLVAQDKWGISDLWGGADVGIVTILPTTSSGDWRPDPRYIKTVHASELSWLFKEVRDMFMVTNGYGMWKEEFFGRLGNRAASCPSDCTVKFLLSQTLHEAYLMNDEITRLGDLQHLNVTSGNQILDDIEGDAGKRSSWVMDSEDISMFYLNRGIAF